MDSPTKSRALRAALENSLRGADDLGLHMVAAHIAHALNLLGTQSEDTPRPDVDGLLPDESRGDFSIC